ncbi:MAG: hypothetical protein A2Y14_05175 [Verrucomicrobia bacterium GWF2_51_19]|nr:MAG: hypothetical protein A2Y14_05175 [Verrucomicrobia bacterium GWF2_51_19]HCJ12358.1 RluA family pseudouridine synthase [Opitutae bacterium]
MWSIIVDVPEAMRVDAFLAHHFEDMSRSYIQKAIRELRINGVPAPQKQMVKMGDTIEVEIDAPTLTQLTPFDGAIDVLYEDEDLIAINKEPGVVVHPGNGTGNDTVVARLIAKIGREHLSALSGNLRPGVVHRLDKDTSGILLFAKTDRAYLKLIELFASREIDKQYLALVSGKPRLLSGCIRLPIGRNPANRTQMAVVENGKPARTDWVLEKSFGPYSLVRCWLHTGRTHQIRVHLSALGHPILGDKAYGYRPIPGICPPRILLHATRLQLIHPFKQTELLIEAPMPPDMNASCVALTR